MSRLRRLLHRIFGDRGPWTYTMVATRGPGWPYSGKPKPKPSDYVEQAREFCRLFGHVLYHGICTTCRRVIVKDPAPDPEPEQVREPEPVA